MSKTEFESKFIPGSLRHSGKRTSGPAPDHCAPLGAFSVFRLHPRIIRVEMGVMTRFFGPRGPSPDHAFHEGDSFQTRGRFSPVSLVIGVMRGTGWVFSTFFRPIWIANQLFFSKSEHFQIYPAGFGPKMGGVSGNLTILRILSPSSR